MLNKKQIAIVITSAILCVGTSLSFAVVQVGGLGSVSNRVTAASGIPASNARSINAVEHEVCEEAKAKVAKDRKDDEDDRKHHEESRSRSLTHHSNHDEDGRKKHDEEKEAKHVLHLKEMQAVCTAKARRAG